MNILIVGAGQLGSRHLQSCLKLSLASSIYVVDPNSDSLVIAKQRAIEVDMAERHQLNYCSDLSEVTVTEFDFLIVATGSKVRIIALSEVLDRFSVKNVILEKVLFQDVASYQKAKQILAVAGANTFVNCPLRAYPFYKDIKKRFFGKGSTVNLNYSGGDWIGLACNSIHYIDLVNFFIGCNVQTVDVSGLDQDIMESKRPGYLEFSGTLDVVYSNGSKLTVKSIRGSDQDSLIELVSRDYRVVIDELSGSYEIYQSGSLLEKSVYEIMYQSNLTHLMIEQIQETGTCDLIGFDESVELHLPFITELLEFYNSQLKQKQESLPIT